MKANCGIFIRTPKSALELLFTSCWTTVTDGTIPNIFIKPSIILWVDIVNFPPTSCSNISFALPKIGCSFIILNVDFHTSCLPEKRLFPKTVTPANLLARATYIIGKTQLKINDRTVKTWNSLFPKVFFLKKNKNKNSKIAMMAVRDSEIQIK